MRFVAKLALIMAGAGWLGHPAAAQIPGYIPAPAAPDTALSLRLFGVPHATRDSSGLALNDLIRTRPLTDSVSSTANMMRCPMPMLYTGTASHDRMPVSHPDVNKSEPMPVARGSCVDLLWRKVESGKLR